MSGTNINTLRIVWDKMIAGGYKPEDIATLLELDATTVTALEAPPATSRVGKPGVLKTARANERGGHCPYFGSDYEVQEPGRKRPTHHLPNCGGKDNGYFPTAAGYRYHMAWVDLPVVAGVRVDNRTAAAAAHLVSFRKIR